MATLLSNASVSIDSTPTNTAYSASQQPFSSTVGVASTAATHVLSVASYTDLSTSTTVPPMSLLVPSSVNTTTDAAPIVPDVARVKIPGQAQMFANMVEWCGADGLSGALAVERANIALGLPIWREDTEIRIASWSGATARWSQSSVGGGPAGNARTAVLTGGKRITMGSDTATVTTTTVAPAGGNPNDVLVNQALNLFYVNINGVWGAGQPVMDAVATVAAAANAAQTSAAAAAPLASPAFTGTPSAPTPATSDSSTRLATTAFVAALVGTLTGVLKFKSTIDASTSPNYPASVAGDVYVFSVAGKIGGPSGKSVDVGDTLISIAASAAGNDAAVGAAWDVIEHNLVGALLSANNLSDLPDKLAAWANLGGDSRASPIIHFPSFAAYASALADKQAGGANALAWVDGQRLSNATESCVLYRVWSAANKNARVAYLTATKSITVIGDANTITPTTGAPSGGAAGDVKVDTAVKAYYTNTAGAWSLTGFIDGGGLLTSASYNASSQLTGFTRDGIAYTVAYPDATHIVLSFAGRTQTITTDSSGRLINVGGIV